MPGPRRTPWIAIDVDIRKDDRVADLPSDAARWGYVAGVLAEARLQTPRGVFGSRATFEEAVGRFARYLEQYITAGLMERATSMCGDCAREYGDVRRGGLVVHNWARKQRDPTAADRQARRRNDHDEGDDQPPDPGPKRPAPRPGLPPNGHGDVTASVTPMSRQRHGNVTGASRARAETQTQTLDTRRRSGTPGVTPREEPAAGTSSAALIDLDRPDVAALRRRGWTRLSHEQIDRLDEVSDYERTSEYDAESGQRIVASWILEAPRGSELLTWVFERSRRLRDERQARADARIAEHEGHKVAALHPSLRVATS